MERKDLNRNWEYFWLVKRHSVLLTCVTLLAVCCSENRNLPGIRRGGGGYQGKPTRPTQASLQLLGTCWDPRAKFHFFDYDLNRNWGGMDTISLTTPGHVQLWNVTSDKKKWIRNILRTNIIHPMFAKAKSKKVSQQNTTASFLSSCNYHPVVQIAWTAAIKGTPD